MAALGPTAAIRLPRISNSTDIEALACEPGVIVRWVSEPADLADVDVIVIPGSKATVADLGWLRERGLADAIVAHAGAVLGICGGFQMLCRRIDDTVESRCGTVEGLGLLDADIYGPSQPMMMGIEGRPESSDGQTMDPMENYGVQVMSIGFLVDQDEAMIWRGPMATQALEQLLRQTNWKSLDYLIVDMPPGTGDIQLTLSQRVPMTGAVIVTTPQDIALLDAKKGIKMFEKVGVPILGLVENMAVHVCTNCGHIEHIFGADGGKKMAEQYNMDYLGALPLNMQIRLQADSGKPTVVADPDGDVAGIYKAVARQVAVKIAAKAKDFSSKFPSIKISKET